MANGLSRNSELSPIRWCPTTSRRGLVLERPNIVGELDVPSNFRYIYRNFHLRAGRLPRVVSVPFTEQRENMSAYEYRFTAIRGIQAGREYYAAMCPLKLVPKILVYNGAEVREELRAQRTLNKARVPDISEYIVENADEYIFSALTASIDGEVRFQPFDEAGDAYNAGKLIVSMDAKFLINDGQHRRAAIERALEEAPELGDETITIVLFRDAGLKRSQQMFADLNKHAVRPSKSLGILYNHRDPLSELCRLLMQEVPVFHGMIEKAKTSLSNRSIKLFTLSVLYQATRALLGKPKDPVEVTTEEQRAAVRYWTKVGENMPDWRAAAAREINSGELRKEFVHAHGVALHALGRVGNALVDGTGEVYSEPLTRLSEIDWRRSNADLWEGRAMVEGRLRKGRRNVILTGNAIKRHIDLPLTDREAEVEEEFLAHQNGDRRQA